MAAMSASGVSRASTTRENPHSLASSAPCTLQHPACVDRCSTICGYISFNARPRKMSCRRMASAPPSHAARAASKKAGTSSSRMSVLSATYTFAPRRCASRVSFRRAETQKFSALSRAENRVSPRYTASAPARSAAYAVCSSPAGARISVIYRPIVRAISSCAASYPMFFRR